MCSTGELGASAWLGHRGSHETQTCFCSSRAEARDERIDHMRYSKTDVMQKGVMRTVLFRQRVKTKPELVSVNI